MGIHRIYIPGCEAVPGDSIEIRGDEAHHAVRSKRLEVDAPIEILDGSGLRALARITAIEKLGKGEWQVRAAIERANREDPEGPSLRVLASAPKGPRLEEMIDQLSQVGAASWAPLIAERTVVTPRTGKLKKSERVAMEAAKQCGRSWVLEVGGEIGFDDALRSPGVIVADASGEPYAPDWSPELTLLIGPEGGFTPDELLRARESGVRIVRFGRHVMRVETAAVVGAGIILGTADR